MDLRHGGALLLLGAGLAVGLAGACGDAAPARRPDVVLVLIDTLRPDHLDLYGYERETAPWIAELGARGAVFERAYSSSAWTPPSTASVFTGLYPTGHGLVHGFGTAEWVEKQVAEGHAIEIEVAQLPTDHATLPERLQSAGYTTWGLTTNPHIIDSFGFARGFDRFQSRSDEPAEKVVDQVIARKEALVAGDRPYFLYLHLNDVHKPYDPREPWFGRWHAPGADVQAESIAAYDSEIAYLDAQLRRLSEALAWDEDTLICLVSDHGEAFMEHGHNGHNSSIHVELNRVLMMLAGPGVSRGRVTANASLIDVMPTLLELAGLSPGAMDGISLQRLLDADARAAETARLAERILFAHRRGMSESALESALDPASLWSVLRGDWRLIVDELEEEEGLYDLAADPLEQDDRLEAEPARAEELRAILDRFRARGFREAGAKARVSMDQELLDELEKMGYAGGDE
jgi:arylsulfatase A-like enzyme